MKDVFTYLRDLNTPKRVICKTVISLNKKDGQRIIQKAILKSGLNIKVDGLIGPITSALLKKVKTEEFLRNIEKIIAGEPDLTIESPVWLKHAFKEIGVKEIRGSKHNPRILEYHSVSGGFSTDEVPWCGSFVNFIMLKSGYEGPKYPARAKSWLKFGKTAGRPVYGAIAVKSRKGGGHVCFVVGKSSDGKYLYCLGGNQDNAVNIKRYRKDVFIDFRIPIDYRPIEVPIYKGKASIAGSEA